MWTLGCYLKRVSNLSLRQDLAAASVCILPSIASRQLKKRTVVVMRNHSFYWKYTNYAKEWGGGFCSFFFILNKVCVGAHRPVIPGAAEGQDLKCSLDLHQLSVRQGRTVSCLQTDQRSRFSLFGGWLGQLFSMLKIFVSVHGLTAVRRELF